MIEVPNKSVAILTNFTSADAAYSLNRVVQDQIKMLIIHGYKVKVIVAEGFEAIDIYAHPSVELKTIPSVPCHNEIKKDESFDRDVDALTNSLEAILKEVNVVLTHDVIYQPACLKHNFAARKIAEKYPSIKWLHWIHSATSPYTLDALLGIFEDGYLELVRKPFPNSYYIFFNNYSKQRIANNFGVDESLVKTVHHPIDICGFYGFDNKVTELVDVKNILDADAVCYYPCRLDRGKQVEVVIKTMAMVKDLDFKVRVIIVDFHSTAGDKVKYRDELKSMAIDWGLNAQELTFTSEFCEAWSYEVPHKIVRDFTLLSNILIMPSKSESYSLVTQEAGVDGKIIVLNQDFPPFRDIFGPNAIYRKYSSNIDVMNGMDGFTNTEYGPSHASPQERLTHEKRYHRDTAHLISKQLLNNLPQAMRIHLRTTRNLRYIFKKQIEPLFYD